MYGNSGKRRMLVIGASGLVGGNLLRLCFRSPCVVIPAFHTYVPDEYTTAALKLDITDPDAVQKGLEISQPDCVVNLSCMEVAQSEAYPARARAVHAQGVQELAHACRTYDIRLIHLSTDMVYSGRKGIPYTLEDAPDPVSVYGRTKLEGEWAIQEAGGDYAIVRSALVLGRDSLRRRGFLEWMVGKAEERETLPLYTDQLRTPLVVDDLVDVIFRLAESAHTGTILAGGGEGLNRVEIGRKLLSAMKCSHELIQPILAAEQKTPVPLQLDLRLDNSSLKKILGEKELMKLDDYFAGLFPVVRTGLSA